MKSPPVSPIMRTPLQNRGYAAESKDGRHSRQSREEPSYEHYRILRKEEVLRACPEAAAFFGE